MIELLAAVIALAPLVGGVASWLAGDRIAGRASGVGLAAGIAASLTLAGIVFQGGPVRAFAGVVVVDALGAYVLVLVGLVTSVAIAGSPAYLAHEAVGGHLRRGDRGRYYALLAWFAGGLATIPLVDNLGLVWIGVEATTIVSSLLVGFSRTPAALEAAWKYLILGSIGIGFALLGTLLVYASSVGVLGETSDALNWSRLVEIALRLDPGLTRLAFIFAVAGYGTKAGLVPFHTWLPDAHSQAPSPISALLSGAALAVALYALARFHIVVTATLGPDFSSTLLIGFGLVSVVVAVPFIVAQGDLKRLLAYSSIEHLGLATLALGFGGRLALLGLTLHLASHGLAKATAFLAAGGLVAARGSSRIGRLGGGTQGSPVDARALGIASLALSGLPPSGVFVAEIAIVFGGVQMGYGPAATIAALFLALAVAGILFHVRRVATGWPPRRAAGGAPQAEPGPGSRDTRHRSTIRILALATPLAVVVVAGVWTPSPIADALAQVAAILGAGRG